MKLSRHGLLLAVLQLALCAGLPQVARAAGAATPEAPAVTRDARALMEASVRRHQHDPYVYEEQALILIDAAGNRSVRKARFFLRVEADRRMRMLLVFDDPEEVRGVALLAERGAARMAKSAVYLPALAGGMVTGSADTRGSHFLGTDFAIEDLVVEATEDWNYRIEGTREIGRVPHWVVRAEPRDADAAATTGHGARRHWLRKDTLFIVRTDYLDRRGRLVKRQSWRDLRRIDADSWRADMVLMEDFREQHKTLVKVERRVLSQDYVPAALFEPAWLQARRHLLPVSPDAATAAAPAGGARN